MFFKTHIKSWIYQQTELTQCGASQPGLVYLQGLSTGKIFAMTVERVPRTDNVVRPLTFALQLSAAEASEDTFMLRIAGEAPFASGLQWDQRGSKILTLGSRVAAGAGSTPQE